MKKLADNILSWCMNPEESAIEQAQALAKHPFLFGNVCLMPDTHAGFGMPVGGVVALKGAICPNMVGVDIGCGMLAVKTSLEEITREHLIQIKQQIMRQIPVGFNKYEKKQDHPLFEERYANEEIFSREKANTMKSLGTLGGGNHFIEIQKGDDGYIWFMVHSGSRNLGKQVAEHYDDKAKKLCKMWKHDTLIETKLAVLPEGTAEFMQYVREMNLCLEFALANRTRMAFIIFRIFQDIFPNVTTKQEINIHHNYAALENHFGHNVWVHRKGATLAREGTIGIIPSSQGMPSYIVEGLGNPASLQSCSHGAGRKMSRKKAIETLSLVDECKTLDEKGILHAVRGIDSLDEAPSAYKDIDVVMDEQKDLVKILVKLEPLAVVKG